MGDRAGFTIAEASIAVALIGLGVATSLVVLTKINAIASISRNATGAYTVCQNEIDAILANGPFNPQKTNLDMTVQIPPELALTPTGSPRVKSVDIYKDSTTNVVVKGTLESDIKDVTATYYGIQMFMFQATVTVKYSYLGRNYSFSMNTVRASDI